MLPSAREMYEKTYENDINSQIDDYLNEHQPIKKDGSFEIKLTNELCKILCGYSLYDFKLESRKELKNNILENMHCYENQGEDDDYYYDVKYRIDALGENYSISLILRACKVY